MHDIVPAGLLLPLAALILMGLAASGPRITPDSPAPAAQPSPVTMWCLILALVLIFGSAAVLIISTFWRGISG